MILLQSLNLTTAVKRNAVFCSADTSPEALEVASRRILNRCISMLLPIETPFLYATKTQPSMLMLSAWF